jgi:hypothetical protein
VLQALPNYLQVVQGALDGCLYCCRGEPLLEDVGHKLGEQLQRGAA